MNFLHSWDIYSVGTASGEVGQLASYPDRVVSEAAIDMDETLDHLEEALVGITCDERVVVMLVSLW